MYITDVSKETIYYVQTDEDLHYFYTRHGPNHWTVRMGESDELVYDCKELEQLFSE